MSASIVQISGPEGVAEFYCPACGGAVLEADEGQAEALCEHVAFVVDWVGDLYVGTGLAPALVAAIEEAYPNGIEALAGILPDTAVVFELVEPARGGGHSGSEIVLAIDFLPAG